MIRPSIALSVVLVTVLGFAATGPVAASQTAETTETDRVCIPLGEHPRPAVDDRLGETVVEDLQVIDREAVDEVTNPIAGDGGADAESPSAIERRTPHELRKHGRDDAAVMESRDTPELIVEGGEVVETDDDDQAAALQERLDDAGATVAIGQRVPVKPCRT